MFLKKLKIGNVELRNNILLAPMANDTLGNIAKISIAKNKFFILIPIIF